MIVTGVEMSYKNGRTESVGLVLRGLSYDKVKEALDSGRQLVVMHIPCKIHQNPRCLGDECAECLIKELRTKIQDLEQVVIELTAELIFGDDK